MWCLMKLLMYVFKISCLNEVCVYVKNDCVRFIMKEGLSMFGNQCSEFGDYVKGVLACSHTHFECINEVMNVNQEL